MSEMFSISPLAINPTFNSRSALSSSGIIP